MELGLHIVLIVTKSEADMICITHDQILTFLKWGFIFILAIFTILMIVGETTDRENRKDYRGRGE